MPLIIPTRFYQPRGAFDPASGGASPEVSQFLSRTSGLSGTETTAYTTMIDGLVTDGIWSKIDGLYIFATNTTTTANLNVKSSSFGLTQTGTITFTADQGYTPNGSTGFLNTAYTPSSSGGSLTQNSAFAAVYIRTSRTSSATVAQMGAFSGGSNSLYLIPDISSGTMDAIMNAGAGSMNFTQADTDIQGFWVASRTGSTTTNAFNFRTGTSSLGSNATASTGLSTDSIYIGAMNNGGSAAFFAGDQQAAVAFGGGLTSGEALSLSNRVNAYITAVGANVY